MLKEFKPAILFLVLYGCLLGFLLPHLTLWLDEVLYMIGIRGKTLPEVISYAVRNAGGVPVGYILAYFSTQLLGISEFSARLPSLFSSMAACVGILALARRMQIKSPLLAVVLFATLPVQFRYAIEARPYAAALCISVWSTVALFRLVELPNWPRRLTYGGIVLVGIYTQPYSLFVPGSHLLWLLLRKHRPLTAIVAVAASIVSACILFLPWYLYGAPFWRQEIKTSLPAEFGWNEVRLIFKELTGAGYVGGVLGVGLCAVGLRTLSADSRRFWACYLLVPIAGGIAGDLYFDYFVAIRQFIYVLAPLTILVILGLERLCGEWTRAVVVALALGLIAANVRWWQRPREDWHAASANLLQASADGACVVSVPAETIRLYLYFQPAIRQRMCPPNLAGRHRMAVAVSPYNVNDTYDLLKLQWAKDGWRPVSDHDFTGPRIVSFTKDVNMVRAGAGK